MFATKLAITVVIGMALAGCARPSEMPEPAAAAWPSSRPFPKMTIVERTVEPVLRADRPWEAYCVNYCKVLRIGKAWHMWYQCFPAPTRNDTDSYLCYARSADGVHWDKPALGLVDFGGSRSNNILAAGIVGHDVFLDPSAPAEQQFKMVYVKAHGGEWWVYGGVSADGIRWRWLDEPLLARNSDTQLACVREADRYRLYVRMWTEPPYNGKRAVGYTESPTFGNFPPPRLVLEPQAPDAADLHFYNSAASKVCDGLYVLLPVRQETWVRRHNME
jgi:hypothetical protein